MINRAPPSAGKPCFALRPSSRRARQQAPATDLGFAAGHQPGADASVGNCATAPSRAGPGGGWLFFGRPMYRSSCVRLLFWCIRREHPLDRCAEIVDTRWLALTLTLKAQSDGSGPAPPGGSQIRAHRRRRLILCTVIHFPAGAPAAQQGREGVGRRQYPHQFNVFELVTGSRALRRS